MLKRGDWVVKGEMIGTITYLKPDGWCVTVFVGSPGPDTNVQSFGSCEGTPMSQGWHLQPSNPRTVLVEELHFILRKVRKIEKLIERIIKP